MQVALATLWSCFPVSASGADVLLFSLLHTSSGSCCSPETNHGLRCLSRSPLFFLSLSLSLCFLSPHYLSFLTVFFFSLSGSLHLSVFLLLALLPFGHAKAALPQHGHPGEGKRPGPQWSSPPGRKKKRDRETSLSSTPPQSLSVCTVDFVLLKKTRSTFSSHTEPLPALPV